MSVGAVDVDTADAVTVGTVAVVAHRKKKLGGGLNELRTLISQQGVDRIVWYEVATSAKVPKKARRALEQGRDQPRHPA